MFNVSAAPRLVSSVALLLGACDMAVDDAPREAGFDDAVAVASTDAALTKGRPWPSSTIPVCWSDIGFSTDADRAFVRDAVESAFGTTRVRFSGWTTTCPAPGESAIRIQVPRSAAWRSNSQVGPTTANPSIQINLDDIRRRFTLVHEFGHAVGMPHEHTRIGSPCLVIGDAPRTAEGYGPYDANSVMNYCGPNTGALSPGDELTLAKMYGFPGQFQSDTSGWVNRLWFDNDGLMGCHVKSPAQMEAFGGFRLVTQTSWTQPRYADCAWPGGLHRVFDQATVRFVSGNTICNIASETQLAAYGGWFGVMVAPVGTTLGNQLQDIGTCPWPGGFYRVPSLWPDAVMRTFEPTKGWCLMANADQSESYRRLGATVRDLPGVVNVLAGPYLGLCGFPEGFYRGKGTAAVRYMRPDTGWSCHVQNETQMEAYGGFTRVQDVALMSTASSQSPLFGRADIGECAWPNGLFRYASGNLASYTIRGLYGVQCVVRDDAQLERLKRSYGAVRLIPETSDLFVNSRYAGNCLE